MESFLGPWEVWIWSHFSSGFWGGAWWAQGSRTPGPARVKIDFQAQLTSVLRWIQDQMKNRGAARTQVLRECQERVAKVLEAH